VLRLTFLWLTLSGRRFGGRFSLSEAILACGGSDGVSSGFRRLKCSWWSLRSFIAKQRGAIVSLRIYLGEIRGRALLHSFGLN